MRLLNLALVLALAALAVAQPPAPAPGRAGGRGGPQVVSPQIESDGRVTFRILAPRATTVTVTGDLSQGLVPDPSQTTAAPVTPVVNMTKGTDGIWTGTTVRSMKPGAWRYAFNVDGAVTVDSRNVHVSQSQTQVQSLLVVPGDFSETRDVPHGSLASVRYVAASLGNARRELYVYTPPGYEISTTKYPVLYLIHGGGDTAVSWSTVGSFGHVDHGGGRRGGGLRGVGNQTLAEVAGDGDGDGPRGEDAEGDATIAFNLGGDDLRTAASTGAAGCGCRGLGCSESREGENESEVQEAHERIPAYCKRISSIWTSHRKLAGTSLRLNRANHPPFLP